MMTKKEVEEQLEAIKSYEFVDNGHKQMEEDFNHILNYLNGKVCCMHCNVPLNEDNSDYDPENPNLNLAFCDNCPPEDKI